MVWLDDIDNEPLCQPIWHQSDWRQSDAVVSIYAIGAVSRNMPAIASFGATSGYTQPWFNTTETWTVGQSRARQLPGMDNEIFGAPDEMKLGAAIVL
ncbi:hypothetical protein PDO_2862 [Rhizobium sp. PDO1-076]|nr:hypothetical protein PDO_2862 [Rhizobium sp. PDO1-076]